MIELMTLCRLLRQGYRSSIKNGKHTMKNLIRLKQQAYLSIYCNVSFKDIGEIANTVFGQNAKSYQRSFFRVINNKWLWCPKLSM